MRRSYCLCVVLCVGCEFHVAGVGTSSSDFGVDLRVSDLAQGDGSPHVDLLHVDAQKIVDMAQKPTADMTKPEDMTKPRDMAQIVGMLFGSIGYPAPTLDLTSAGTSDWLTIGYSGQASDVERKSTGNSQISFAAVNLQTWSGFYMVMSWEDGSPTKTGSNDTKGISGTTITLFAPADTTTRTLTIYLGSSDTCTVVAHLSDGSAADYAPSAFSAMDERTAILTYAAASSGQNLEVTLSADTNQYPVFEAATLVVGQ